MSAGETRRALVLARAIAEEGADAAQDDDVQELAALVLVLLMCQKCDEVADVRRCEAHAWGAK